MEQVVHHVCYIESNSPLSDLESFQRPDVVIAFRKCIVFEKIRINFTEL